MTVRSEQLQLVEAFAGQVKEHDRPLLRQGFARQPLPDGLQVGGSG
jgi:hypothetical protein